MSTEKTPKNADKFICNPCNFKCSKQCDYNIHLLTAKHQRTYTDLQQTYNKTYILKNKKEPKIYVCDCGIEYKYRQSLNKHKQTCGQKNAKNAESLNSCGTKFPPKKKVISQST